MRGHTAGGGGRGKAPRSTRQGAGGSCPVKAGPPVLRGGASEMSLHLGFALREGPLEG